MELGRHRVKTWSLPSVQVMTFQGHTEVSPTVSSTVVGAKQSFLGWSKKNAIETGSLHWALRDFKRQRWKENFQGVRD